MFSYFWPIALVVLANTAYHICSKSTPQELNPFAALTVTYAVATVFSAILYAVSYRGENLIREYAKLNYAPFALGLAIVGLEAGFLYAYKVGWQVSTASIVQCSFLTIVLIFVGALLFNEALTWNKIVGIAICLVGLIIINLK